MACLAAAAALMMVALDRGITHSWLLHLGWSYNGGAEGASLLLGTVAGSMIAIAGTVFLTLVALSLASSQLGPRLRGHADLIIRGAREGVPEPDDVLAVEARFQVAAQSLGDPPG